MRRDTKQQIRASKDDPRSLEERIADAAAAAAEREQGRHAAAGHIITSPSLPTNRTTELVTVTTDELHDLVYASVSNVLRRQTSLSTSYAQQAAARAALEGQQIARANGWITRGADPRS